MHRLNYKTFFHILFGLFLISLPFSKGVNSVAYVGLLLLSFGGLFFRKPNFAPLKKGVFPASVLFFMLFASCFYSTNTEEGMAVLLSQSKMLGLPLLVAINADLIQKRYHGYIFIWIRGVVIAACITLLLLLLPTLFVQELVNATQFLQEYIAHEKIYAFGAYSPFIDRLQFSYLIVLAFFLECWSTYQLSPPRAFPYLPINFHTSILLITLIILGARGAQLGCIAGIGVWIIGIYFQYGHSIVANQYGSSLSYLLLIGGLGITTFVLPYIAYKTIPPLQERYNQLLWEIGTYQDGTIQNYEYTYFTSIRRWLSWKHSWELVQQSPIMGTGIGDYRMAMEQAYAKDQLQFPMNTHSQFLYYWVSGGLLALLAFIGLWCYWLYQGFQQPFYWKKVLFSAIFIFYILVLLLDAPLNFQVGATTFWMIYALLLVEEDTFFIANA